MTWRSSVEVTTQDMNSVLCLMAVYTQGHVPFEYIKNALLAICGKLDTASHYYKAYEDKLSEDGIAIRLEEAGYPPVLIEFRDKDKSFRVRLSLLLHDAQLRDISQIRNLRFTKVLTSDEAKASPGKLYRLLNTDRYTET